MADTAEAPLLSVEALHVRYGALAAVRDVSFTVQPGELIAVLGPNGAGKSTLLRAITGMVKPSAGRVVLDGRDVTGSSSVSIAKRGVAHVLEGRGIFPDLTVAENLTVAAHPLAKDARAAALETVHGYFPILDQRRDQAAGSLSGGEQQQLAIARALITSPRLLLLDEMSLGLAPKIVEGLFTILAKVHGAGTTVLLVEQYVSRALAIADRAIVLEKGAIHEQGSAEELARSTALTESYFGDATNDNTGAEQASEPISVTLPARMVRALTEQADREHTTVAALATKALAAGLLVPERDAVGHPPTEDA